jgi:O-antigen/teichoic acid export membrane protein
MIAGLRRPAKTAVTLTGVRLAGAAVGLLVQVALARLIAPEAFGLYLFAAGTASVACVLAALGYPNVVNRFTARYRARLRPRLASAFLAQARRDIAIAAVALTALIAGAFALFQQGEPRMVSLLALLAIVPLAHSRLYSAVANAERRPLAAYLPELAARPAAMLAVVGAFFATGVPLSSPILIVAFVVIGWGVFALHLGLSRTPGLQGRSGLPPRASLARAWRRGTLPSITLTLATALFPDLVIVAAGVFLGHGALALFGVAVKVAFLIGFLTQISQQASIPDLADALARGERRALTRLALPAVLTSIGGTSLAGLALLAFGGDVLRLFGPDYAAAQSALLVLAFGQVVRAAGGPVFQVAVLIGDFKLVNATLIAGFALLTALLAVLAGPFGALGAAIAVLATQIFWAVVPTTLLWHRGLRAPEGAKPPFARRSTAPAA